MKFARRAVMLVAMFVIFVCFTVIWALHEDKKTVRGWRGMTDEWKDVVKMAKKLWATGNMDEAIRA